MGQTCCASDSGELVEVDNVFSEDLATPALKLPREVSNETPTSPGSPGVNAHRKPSLNADATSQAIPANVGHDDSKQVHLGGTCTPGTSAVSTRSPSETTEKRDTIDSPREALTQLEASLSNIQACCKQCRILDAVDLLNRFEIDLASAQSLTDSGCEEDVLESIEKLRRISQSDATLCKLRRMHSRFENYLKPDGLYALAMQDDERWSVASRKEPRVGEHFRLEVKIRILEKAERDPNGETTQVVFCISLIDWPMRVEEFVALDREIDLIKKEWIQDCREVNGKVAGPEELMSALYHYKIRPALLPIAFEFLQHKEYAVCSTPPTDGLPSGTFVIEDTPPTQAKFEGFDLPLPTRATKRINFRTIKSFTPSVEHPGCSTQVIVTKAGVNIPTWMLPTSFSRDIIFETTMKTFISFKEKAADRWNENGYQSRMAGARSFYDSVRNCCGSNAEST